MPRGELQQDDWLFDQNVMSKMMESVGRDSISIIGLYNIYLYIHIIIYIYMYVYTWVIHMGLIIWII